MAPEDDKITLATIYRVLGEAMSRLERRLDEIDSDIRAYNERTIGNEKDYQHLKERLNRFELTHKNDIDILHEKFRQVTEDTTRKIKSETESVEERSVSRTKIWVMAGAISIAAMIFSGLVIPLVRSFLD